MSPEQARGEEDLDQRIDVYALGVILYECLTGTVPFGGTNYLGIIQQVLQEAPEPPRRRAPDRKISEGMERVVLKALAKSRDHRYPSMEAMARDLQRVAAGETVEAPGLSSPAPSPASRRRPAGLFAAVGGVAVAGAVALALVVGRIGRPPVAPAAAALPSPPPVAAAIAAPAPPASVIVKVNSTPPGAEILDGARRLGVAPASIELARSDKPVHLTFRLVGYRDGATDLVPKIDGEQLNIELLPAKKAPRAKPKVQAAAPTPRPSGAEQLPAGTPYAPK
jgi:serine/threonine-protein kinase